MVLVNSNNFQAVACLLRDSSESKQMMPGCVPVTKAFLPAVDTCEGSGDGDVSLLHAGISML